MLYELWKGTRAEFDATQGTKPYRKAYIENTKKFLDKVDVEWNLPILEWGTNLAFREFIKQSFAKSPSGKVLKYVPDIRDVQVAGDVAYEWGYFDSTFRASDQEQPVSFRAKFIRVLKQQPDGTWKFTRVIWTPE